MSLFACQSIHQEDPEDERFFILYGFGCSISRSVNISRGGSWIFFGEGALVSLSTSTPINHIVFLFFFFAEYQLYQWLENRRSSPGGGGAHPQHPPPTNAPDKQEVRGYLSNPPLWRKYFLCAFSRIDLPGKNSPVRSKLPTLAC